MLTDVDMAYDECDAFQQQQMQSQLRRKEICKIVYLIWTNGGSDITGIAEPLFLGQVDALGLFMTDLFNVPQSKEEHSADDASMKITTGRVDAANISYDNFFHDYMSRNVPVIINGLTEGWQASEKWIAVDILSEDAKQVPDMEYLKRTFGSDVVSVHMQSSGGFSNFSHCVREKNEMKLEDYAEWWSDYHLKAALRHGALLKEDEEEDLLYMKDWKFVAEHPDYAAYVTPKFFVDDWLNGSTGMGNAYRFCYLGPKGTVTPLHADVLDSYSWSSNVCGRKKWYMIPPLYTHLLFDVFGCKLACHLHADLDYRCGLGKVLYPGLAIARSHAICVIQEQGETLFVPSGWHHSVENLEATLSINHNWINGTNVLWSWNKVLRELTNGASSFDLGLKSFPFARTSIDALPLECPTVRGSDNIFDGNSNEGHDDGAKEDDLFLLWLIVSQKAQFIMRDNKTYNLDPPYPDDRYNLQRIETVLHGIHELLRIRMEKGLTIEQINPKGLMTLLNTVKRDLRA